MLCAHSSTYEPPERRATNGGSFVQLFSSFFFFFGAQQSGSSVSVWVDGWVCVCVCVFKPQQKTLSAYHWRFVSAAYEP